jgi:hypothetical protein
MVLSEAFGLRGEAEANANSLDAPELGSAPLFSRSYGRAPVPAAVESLATLDRALTAPDFSGVARRADTPPSPATLPGTVSVPSRADAALLDPRSARASHRGPDVLVARIIESSLDVDQKVRHLFLAMVHREPTPEEKRLAEKLIRRQPDARQGLDHVWWALLGSREFVAR